MSKIQETHPLKQGLKLTIVLPVDTAATDSRDTSTKTRIETSERLCLRNILENIQETHPLKQGLKLSIWSSVPSVRQYSRDTSTKTRIETSQIVRYVRKIIKFKRHIH